MPTIPPPPWKNTFIDPGRYVDRPWREWLTRFLSIMGGPGDPTIPELVERLDHLVPDTRALTLTGGANLAVTPGVSQDLSLDRSWSLTLTGPYAQTSFPAHALLTGNGAGPLASVPAGATGELLAGVSGQDPAFLPVLTGAGLTFSQAGGALVFENTGLLTLDSPLDSLTITTAAGVAHLDLNMAHHNTWTAVQTFNQAQAQTATLLATTPGQAVHLRAPATVPGTSWILTLPQDDGTPGQALTTDGFGVTSWATASGGTVTSITTTDGSLTGGPITSTGNLALNVTHANIWTALQTFDHLALRGISGSLLTLDAAAGIWTAWTLTLPTAPAPTGGLFTTDATGHASWIQRVSQVATDSTLTGGPITTAGTLGLNLASANAWSAQQTMPSLRLPGTGGTSFLTLQAPASAFTSWGLTLPAAPGTTGQALIATDNVGGTGWATVTGGGGGVTSVSPGAGILVSPTTGLVVVSLDVAHTNVWTAHQEISGVGLNLDSAGNPGAGVVNARNYRYQGHAAAGSYLRGDGTNFIENGIQGVDIPALPYLRLLGALPPLTPPLIQLQAPQTTAFSNYTMVLPPNGGVVDALLRTDGGSPTAVSTWVKAIAPATVSLDYGGGIYDGQNYLEMPAQSAAPGLPTNLYLRLYADGNARLSWRRHVGTDTFSRTLSSTLTADRVYTLPDATMTFAGLEIPQTFTARHNISLWTGGAVPTIGNNGVPMTLVGPLDTGTPGLDQLNLELVAFGATAGSRVVLLRARGTPTAPVHLNAGDAIGQYGFGGYHDTQGWTTNLHTAFMRAAATEDWVLESASPSNIIHRGTELQFFMTPNGSPSFVGGTSSLRGRLFGSGTIGWNMPGNYPDPGQAGYWILNGWDTALVPATSGGPPLTNGGIQIFLVPGNTAAFAFDCAQDSGSPQAVFRRSRGTPAAPTAIHQALISMGTFTWRAYITTASAGSNYTGNIAQLRSVSREQFTDINHTGSAIDFFTTPIATAGGQRLVMFLGDGLAVGTVTATCLADDKGFGTIHALTGYYAQGVQGLTTTLQVTVPGGTRTLTITGGLITNIVSP